jgi:thiamine-monophosphate kinase
MSQMGPGAEFDRIRGIAAALGPRAAEVGDDCAMVPLNGGFLALSTDVSVEGVHFRRDWLTLEEIGWRAAAGALSDLAAAGADPVGLLAAITVPPGLNDAATVQLMEGVGDAVTAVGGQVLGGDLSRGDQLQLAITVVGSTAAWVGRSGAQPGDTLWVSGALGGARAALAAWQGGGNPAPVAREAFARPRPRIALGRRLVQAGAHAMLDLSDGLAGDAAHLASASGRRIVIDLTALPLHAGVALGDPREAVCFAAQGGEDYELLAALPAESAVAIAALGAELGIALTAVGRVEEGEGVRLEYRGEAVELRSFDHFR